MYTPWRHIGGTSFDETTIDVTACGKRAITQVVILLFINGASVRRLQRQAWGRRDLSMRALRRGLLNLPRLRTRISQWNQEKEPTLHLFTQPPGFEETTFAKPLGPLLCHCYGYLYQAAQINGRSKSTPVCRATIKIRRLRPMMTLDGV